MPLCYRILFSVCSGQGGEEGLVMLGGGVGTKCPFEAQRSKPVTSIGGSGGGGGSGVHVSENACIQSGQEEPVWPRGWARNIWVHILILPWSLLSDLVPLTLSVCIILSYRVVAGQSEGAGLPRVFPWAPWKETGLKSVSSRDSSCCVAVHLGFKTHL